ncbi:hypothetical protein CEXT_111781 [Caerostris extrusa]|uniref:Uncharacterized protein n=1 Tax=Caerostris extrusa TaxID=172846 RepID=A0AAV4Q0R7_CAEEX|nr:hypothetical protein CEXT_111781 [Caerostris extrusa]
METELTRENWRLQQETPGPRKTLKGEWGVESIGTSTKWDPEARIKEKRVWKNLESLFFNSICFPRSFLKKPKVVELSIQVRLPLAKNTPRAANPFGSIFQAASGAHLLHLPHPNHPAGMYRREQKIRFKKIRTKTSPQGHRNSLSPHPGFGGGYFPDGNRLSDIWVETDLTRENWRLQPENPGPRKHLRRVGCRIDRDIQ